MASSQTTVEINGSEANKVLSAEQKVSEAPRSSQTAKDFIETQLRLEADAREALPYAFDTCTQPLGPLRQNLFSCLTCRPPPTSPSHPYTPAAVCYSCSIACHGEHTLVELFNRRNFVCDCGTIRLPNTSPCTLRIDPATGMKGPVHSQEPAKSNTYNQNCQNRFCGCCEEYDADKEKGTMFQCLGLADEKDGGCGEDWWHPECVIWGGEVGKIKRREGMEKLIGESGVMDDGLEDGALPPGFPDEDDFETFICYKCVEVAPWVKQYAGTEGFLPAVYRQDIMQENTTNGHATNGPMDEPAVSQDSTSPERDNRQPTGPAAKCDDTSQNGTSSPRKRSANTAGLDDPETEGALKRVKPEEIACSKTCHATPTAYHTTLPPAPLTPFSLFCKEDFRDHFCRCKDCYPALSKYPQLLEEEEAYEPPLSESGDAGNGSGSVGSKSLLERGEAALSNVDRVRAIEGVMVYNHLKDKVKSFLQPFAESGQAVGAEDIKAYFEKLRGDEQAIKNAGSAPSAANDTEGEDPGAGGGDNRREQS
ncbi:MAG: hypothetical protein Q9163_006180, partial [Psora crenata]